jgi:hypothetical protein
MISYLKSFFQNLSNIIYKKKRIFTPLTNIGIKIYFVAINDKLL